MENSRKTEDPCSLTICYQFQIHRMAYVSGLVHLERECEREDVIGEMSRNKGVSLIPLTSGGLVNWTAKLKAGINSVSAEIQFEPERLIRVDRIKRWNPGARAAPTS
jgi:hypothetical protein